jgi:DNA-binding CsgD family transcriptional regulator
MPNDCGHSGSRGSDLSEPKAVEAELARHRKLLQRAEREIAAHVAVAEALMAWESLEKGGERLLRELTAALDFAVAALWLPQGDVLAPRLFWSAPTCETREFERATSELCLAMGIGLPGRAWERRQPIGLARVIADDGFIRHEAAARNGLRAGVAMPALRGDEVLAVVELYSRDRAALSERLIRLLTGVGYELGTFLARRRGELEPPLLTSRQLEILQLAAEGLAGRSIAERLGVSGATVKTHFEHIYERLGVSDRAAAVAHALRGGLIQ